MATAFQNILSALDTVKKSQSSGSSTPAYTGSARATTTVDTGNIPGEISNYYMTPSLIPKIDPNYASKVDAALSKTSKSSGGSKTVPQTISWGNNGGDSGGSSGVGYSDASKAYKEAMDAAYNQTKAQYLTQAEQLKGQYDTTRGQAYTNSRLNAIGNNEALASMGLAGNMYDGPQSGYSETSRIGENTAMRNSINSATLEEQSTRDAIADAIIQAGYTRDQSVAQYTADVILQEKQAELQKELAAQQLQFQYAQLAASMSKK